MQLLGDVQKSLARGDLAITDPAALRELVRLEPGVTVRGRVAGTTPNELGEAPFLVLESTDGRVLLIPQTPAMEERRGEGGLRRGHVVTLREHESVRAGRSVRWTEIQEHGRLRDLVRTRELATVLDLEVLERARAGARPEEPAPARGFARAWARALAGRRLRLAEAGLLVRAGPESERGGGAAWVALPQAASRIALQAKQRERSALSFQEVETLFGKRLEQAKPERRSSPGDARGPRPRRAGSALRGPRVWFPSHRHPQPTTRPRDRFACGGSPRAGTPRAPGSSRSSAGNSPIGNANASRGRGR